MLCDVWVQGRRGLSTFSECCKMISSNLHSQGSAGQPWPGVRWFQVAAVGLLPAPMVRDLPVSTQPSAAHCSRTTPPPRVFPPAQGSLPAPSPPHTHPSSCMPEPQLHSLYQRITQMHPLRHAVHPISPHPASQPSHLAPCIPQHASPHPTSPHLLIPGLPANASSAFMWQPPSLQPGCSGRKALGAFCGSAPRTVWRWAHRSRTDPAQIPHGGRPHAAVTQIVSSRTPTQSSPRVLREIPRSQPTHSTQFCALPVPGCVFYFL